jgi:uncharacterized protein (TIGR03437 family)
VVIVSSAAQSDPRADFRGYPNVQGTVTAAGSTTNTISVTVGGIPATVAYAGIAPGLQGLNQINVTIPAGVNSGNALLAISGPDSLTSEAVIAVSSSLSQ